MLGYNRMTGYNKARYNAEGTALSASETITLSDDLAKSIELLASENLTLSDNLVKQITEKILAETIRLSAWIRLNRKDQDKWGSD